jgi:RNA polymerase sigma-70 factor, ECF subfamily
MDMKITANQANPENIPDTAKVNFENEAFQYIEPIWQTSLLLVKNEDRANQLAQDTFIKAFGRWNQAHYQINCRMLLFKALAELIFPENKWRCRQSELSYSHIHMDDQALPLKSMSCHALSEALAKLRPEMRFVTILSQRWGFSYGEIAEIIGSEIETVRVIVYAGRRQLHREVIRIFNKSAKPDSKIFNTLN